MTAEETSNAVYNAIGGNFGSKEYEQCLQCNPNDPYEILTMNGGLNRVTLALKPVLYDDPAIVFILVMRHVHKPFHQMNELHAELLFKAYQKLVAFMQRDATKKFFSEHGIVYAQDNFYVGQNRAYKVGERFVHGHVHVEFRAAHHEDVYTFAKHQGAKPVTDEQKRAILAFVRETWRQTPSPTVTSVLRRALV